MLTCDDCWCEHVFSVTWRAAVVAHVVVLFTVSCRLVTSSQTPTVRTTLRRGHNLVVWSRVQTTRHRQRRQRQRQSQFTGEDRAGLPWVPLTSYLDWVKYMLELEGFPVPRCAVNVFFYHYHFSYFRVFFTQYYLQLQSVLQFCIVLECRSKLNKLSN